MADVFISYKRAERDQVTRIAELLREEGMDVWFDARLQVGRGEGFDAEIEREVTSASCVVVCWTPEALKSVYVKAEAKKGLERNILVPIMLQSCTLPVPFNGIDTVSLLDWNGESRSPDWQRAFESIRVQVQKSKVDENQRRAHSAATYERIDEKIYPGTLKTLISRIAAIDDKDGENYAEDIEGVLNWLESLAEKENRRASYVYEIAYRQDGGGAWYWWDRGGAAEQARRISSVRAILARIEEALSRSQKTYERPTP